MAILNKSDCKNIHLWPQVAGAQEGLSYFKKVLGEIPRRSTQNFDENNYNELEGGTQGIPDSPKRP